MQQSGVRPSPCLIGRGHLRSPGLWQHGPGHHRGTHAGCGGPKACLELCSLAHAKKRERAFCEGWMVKGLEDMRRNPANTVGDTMIHGIAWLIIVYTVYRFCRW